MTKYIIPLIIIFIFLYSIINKVKPYNTFIDGVKGAIPFGINIFPYLFTIFIITEIFEQSGLSDLLVKIVKPFFNLFGIPSELSKLVLIKPFSGTGSLSIVSEIFKKYGVDSYLSRCACVIYGSSETVFYIASVYFSNNKKRNLIKPITISLFASFFSCVFACFICKIL